MKSSSLLINCLVAACMLNSGAVQATTKHNKTTKKTLSTKKTTTKHKVIAKKTTHTKKAVSAKKVVKVAANHKVKHHASKKVANKQSSNHATDEGLELGALNLDSDVQVTSPNKRVTFKEFLRSPVKNARITSPFGSRYHPIFHERIFHTGIDFAAPVGTPVRATADGVVESRGRENGYGNTLIIKHANGYSTLYAHLSRFGKGIASGTVVKKGEVVAYVGMTGNTTGPHVHYEVRLEDRPINPLGGAFSRTMLAKNDSSDMVKGSRSNRLSNGRIRTVIR